MTPPPEFPGFPDFRSNVTFVPLQFFTIVLPHRSRGCVRLVGFMIRRLLGWVDTDGNPTHTQLEFSYRDLMQGAGLSRDAIAEALTEAQEHRLIECVRAPRPDRPGQAALSGIYTLRWHDDYTNAPAAFMGFCRREAVPATDDNAGRPVTAAKVARKNIPNAFFDYLLRRERLSLARVVGVMLFRSIQWGPGGERKVPVCLSISELSLLTRTSRRHVHEAVQEAMSRGYLERVQEGRFDPDAGAQSHAATYRIRWTSQPVAPVAAPTPPEITLAMGGQTSPYPISDRSEKGYADAVGKGERHQSGKENGDQSEMGNDISIKRSIKNNTTAAGKDHAPEAPSHPAAVVSGVMARLVEAGFDAPTVGHLVRQRPADVIQRQLDWLPLRRACTNRLGLLRRAIESDWPKPDGDGSYESVPSQHALGGMFARHYEAAFHQLPQPPTTSSPKEAAHATEFLRRLDVDATELTAAELGKRFGEFARARAPAKPWLVWVLRIHGDAFVQRTRQSSKRALQVSEADSRRAREEKFHPAYLGYLRAVETAIQHEQPALYAAFEAQREDTALRLNLSERARALLASEKARLSAFGDFIREQGVRVLDFWEWDRRYNRDEELSELGKVAPRPLRT